MNKLIIAIVASTVVMSSCSKDPEKVLPRKSGEWKTSGTLKDVNYITPFTGSMTFNDDKTYQLNWIFSVGNDTLVESGTWSTTENTVTLLAGGEALKFDVTEAKRKSEKWKNITGTQIIEVELSK